MRVRVCHAFIKTGVRSRTYCSDNVWHFNASSMKNKPIKTSTMTTGFKQARWLDTEILRWQTKCLDDNTSGLNSLIKPMWRRGRCCSATLSESDSPNKLREPDRAVEGGGGLEWHARNPATHAGLVITTYKDPVERGQPGAEGQTRTGIQELVWKESLGRGFGLWEEWSRAACGYGRSAGERVGEEGFINREKGTGRSKARGSDSTNSNNFVPVWAW